jgi:hypothetical protein
MRALEYRAPPMLVPELDVRDLATTLNFYADVLDFRVLFERRGERFAYLERDGVELMIQESDGPGRRFRTAALEHPFGQGVNFQLRVEDGNPSRTRPRPNCRSRWPLPGAARGEGAYPVSMARCSDGLAGQASNHGRRARRRVPGTQSAESRAVCHGEESEVPASPRRAGCDAPGHRSAHRAARDPAAVRCDPCTARYVDRFHRGRGASKPTGLGCRSRAVLAEPRGVLDRSSLPPRASVTSDGTGAAPALSIGHTSALGHPVPRCVQHCRHSWRRHWPEARLQRNRRLERKPLRPAPDEHGGRYGWVSAPVRLDELEGTWRRAPHRAGVGWSKR